MDEKIPFYTRKLFALLLIFIIGNASLQAQNHSLRRLVDTLASPYFGGRGYVDSGLQRAAIFIENEMKMIGLAPVEVGYQQPFVHDVVVFDGNADLEIDGKNLKAGKDFVVSPGSRGVQVFKKKLQPLDSIRWIDPASRVVIEMVDKLTWGVATVQDDYTVIYLLRSLLTAPPVTYSLHLEARRVKDFTSNNIIGMIRGSGQPDSFLVLTAHYDHLGKLGKDAIFFGANDNASGVALMLDLAKEMASRDTPPRYSILFIAFAGEEPGLLGSEFYVKNPLLPLEKIRFLVNLDLLGTGEEGIMVVNATEYPNEWKLLDSINKTHGWLKTIGQRGKARNSDHYWFTEAGVPAFFIYTLGGIAAYHDIYDARETLPLTKTAEVGKLIDSFFEILSKNN